MKRLILLGGGHAHISVLSAFARRPLPNTQLVLVSPSAYFFYASMVPGWVAGHYRRQECAIRLRSLAEHAQATWKQDSAVGIHANNRTITLSDGSELAYDWLSINTGPTIDSRALPGATEHALLAKPLDRFVAGWDRVMQLAKERVVRITVVGAGASGVELALAAKWRLKERALVSLVMGGPHPLPSRSIGTQERAFKALRNAGIALFPENAARIHARTVQLANGAHVVCDCAIVAIGASAPSWFLSSRLDVDAQGFIEVDEAHRSCSHRDVFAVGDCATRKDGKHPKSAMYAIQAGPALAKNLRRAVADQPARPFIPPKPGIELISCGPRHAILGGGRWSFEGWWVWQWKNWLNQRFIDRHTITA